MSEEQKIQDGEFKEVEQTKESTLQIEVDTNTAFTLKVQEFDKNIAIAEFQVADLKKQKMCFIYDNNIQSLAEQHKSNLIKKQIEEETLKRSQKK